MSKKSILEKLSEDKKTGNAGFPEPDKWAEYGKLLAIPAICVALILVILGAEAWTGSRAVQTGGASADAGTEVLTGGSTSDAGQEETDPASTDAAVSAADDGSESTAEAETSETAETPEIEPETPIACRVPAIEATINEYFAARLSADVDTLYRLFGRTLETGREETEARLQAQASWIQSFDGITVATMPGLDDLSKVCIVRYRINFRRTDTDAPGIMYCYVTEQSDGSYRIGENLRSDVVQYISGKLALPEVQAMQDETDAALKSALDADSTLALIYTSFLNGEIYNETAPDLNDEQSVDIFTDPAASDLVGGLVIDLGTQETESVGVDETGSAVSEE